MADKLGFFGCKNHSVENVLECLYPLNSSLFSRGLFSMILIYFDVFPVKIQNLLPTVFLIKKCTYVNLGTK